ncbi:MAG: SH3 domain-containing protein [Roseovarius sp.]|nr:SH3 domain-containing protein [Roseovarius sp.]
MRFLLKFLLLSLLPVYAVAQSFPALYDVSKLSAGEKLNIREKPGISSAIIGSFDSGSQDIEVIALNEDGDWGRINHQQRSGWVAMQYLARQSNQPDNALTRPLACFGTKPSWSLDVGVGPSVSFLNPGDEPIAYDNIKLVESTNRIDRYAIFAQSDSYLLTSVFHHAACSDGISGSIYGIGVDIFLTTKEDVRFISGCCSLVR